MILALKGVDPDWALYRARTACLAICCIIDL
jgi:hypothetical protein